MKVIDFKCDQCVLAIVGEPAKIAEYSTEYVEMRFDLCPDWQQMVTVAAMFKLANRQGMEALQVLVEGGRCKVPAEMLRFPGFTFSLWGTDGEGVHSTTNIVQVPVMPNNMRGAYPQPSTPDMFDAILAASNAARDAAEEVVRRADSGEFDGRDFRYWKTYPSIADMELDADNIPDGEFVNINANDVNDVDDSKVFYKKDGVLAFTADHSGAQGIQGPRGDKGEPGTDGVDGKDAVITDIKGAMFGMELDADGNLLVVYDDGSAAPPLEIDENGHLVYTLEGGN